MSARPPDLIVEVTFYLPIDGGRLQPLRGDRQKWYGCKGKLHQDDDQLYDLWLNIEGQVIEPGETRRLELFFNNTALAESLFRTAGQFYLWEDRRIGFGRVLAPDAQ